MTRTKAFDRHAAVYDAWFDQHPAVYESELAAIRSLWPEEAGDSVEVGAGSGRFSLPLCVTRGIEPSAAMRALAAARGLAVEDGVAEALPFGDARFDTLLMVTIDCFLDDPPRAYAEAYRVLRPGGTIVVALIDKDSVLVRSREPEPGDDEFYEEARFHAVDEVLTWLTAAGFRDFGIVQTLFAPEDQLTEPNPIRAGYGTGAFVVVRAHKPARHPDDL
ncbi:MAG: methyltransferase domain-containing protein [Gammaproteobacteria bacterium]|nr:methyltransferase domain-containing protein [Gammaproteobacteria bacterium]